MFYDFLHDKNPDLLKEATEAGVDVKDFEQVFSYNQDSAVRALREIIKTRGKDTDTSKQERIEEFRRKYQKDIQATLKQRDKLISLRKKFADETGVRIIFEWEEPEETFIRLGRAPRGSKMVPGRDLTLLFDFLAENKLPTQLRVSPSDKDAYIMGELLEDGTIQSGEHNYKRPNAWTFAVYSDAVQRGTRTTTVGSPWKAIQVRANTRGDWITLDRAWRNMIDATGEEDTDEEE